MACASRALDNPDDPILNQNDRHATVQPDRQIPDADLTTRSRRVSLLLGRR